MVGLRTHLHTRVAATDKAEDSSRPLPEVRMAPRIDPAQLRKTKNIRITGALAFAFAFCTFSLPVYMVTTVTDPIWTAVNPKP